MDKKLLLEKYIKVAVRKAIQEAEEQQKRVEKAMYLVYRFPGLKKVMEDVMSPSFGRFVTDIKLIAPKPTTFNVKLINEQEFGVIYNGKGKFTVKVSGKKYNIQNLGELERASQSVADLLELSYALDEKALSGAETPKPDAGAEAFSAATAAPAGEIPAETPPAETPAEETPEETPPPTEA
jgi:hypothetical protein